MGQATRFRFGYEPVRGVRIVIASHDKKTVGPIVAALRADGHSVLWVYGATELVFALEVVRDDMGVRPDLLILDTELGGAAIRSVLAEYEAVLALVPVFLILGSIAEEENAALVQSVSPVFESPAIMRRPIDLDDLRTAVLNLEAWKRAVHSVREAPPPPREPEWFSLSLENGPVKKAG